jgi:hypothetical protein
LDIRRASMHGMCVQCGAHHGGAGGGETMQHVILTCAEHAVFCMWPKHTRPYNEVTGDFVSCNEPTRPYILKSVVPIVVKLDTIDVAEGGGHFGTRVTFIDFY